MFHLDKKHSSIKPMSNKQITRDNLSHFLIITNAYCHSKTVRWYVVASHGGQRHSSLDLIHCILDYLREERNL